MPTPFTSAANWHLANCPGVPFREVIEAHCQTGRVFVSPALFLLARPIRVDWEDPDIINPWLSAPVDEADAWHIWLFAGDPSAIAPIVPHPLPYVTFHRRDALRVHSFADIMRFLPRQ